MALSEKIKLELEAERDRLLAERKQIDELLSGIEVVLRLGSQAGSNGKKSPTPSTPPSPLTTLMRDFKSLGLRDAVRRALAMFPEGARPVEVTRVLKEHGFVETGSKHRLSLRVSNDLNRMRGNGEAERDEQGLYRPANGAAAGKNGTGQLDALAGRSA